MDDNKKYDKATWRKKFLAAKDVTAISDVLDKTSNTVFNNTLARDIALGFFSFGSTWYNAIKRSFSNWWNRKKGYRNLYALWKDVKNYVNKKRLTIEKACKKIGLSNDIKKVMDCVKLTLALCARTYQATDARGRWNTQNRNYVFNLLVNTTFNLGTNTVRWFNLLNNQLSEVHGIMGDWLTTAYGQELSERISAMITGTAVIVDSKIGLNNDKK